MVSSEVSDKQAQTLVIILPESQCLSYGGPKTQGTLYLLTFAIPLFLQKGNLKQKLQNKKKHNEVTVKTFKVMVSGSQ